MMGGADMYVLPCLFRCRCHLSLPGATLYLDRIFIIKPFWGLGFRLVSRLRYSTGKRGGGGGAEARSPRFVVFG
jgi:hypothetical protein